MLFLVARDLKFANDFAVGIGEERACYHNIKSCIGKIEGKLPGLQTLVPNIQRLPKDQMEVPKGRIQNRRRQDPLPKMRFLDVVSST